MAENIYENQPCNWVTQTVAATDAYPTDGIGGNTATYASSVFKTSYRNAILQTVKFTATATGNTCSVHLANGLAVFSFAAPSQGTHSFDLGGDAGVFMPGGFHIRFAGGGGVTSMTAFYRPQ
jgi:hypothetical protein